jgi:hypothetical protein
MCQRVGPRKAGPYDFSLTTYNIYISYIEDLQGAISRPPRICNPDILKKKPCFLNFESFPQLRPSRKKIAHPTYVPSDHETPDD